MNFPAVSDIILGDDFYQPEGVWFTLQVKMPKHGLVVQAPIPGSDSVIRVTSGARRTA